MKVRVVKVYLRVFLLNILKFMREIVLSKLPKLKVWILVVKPLLNQHFQWLFVTKHSLIVNYMGLTKLKIETTYAMSFLRAFN